MIPVLLDLLLLLLRIEYRYVIGWAELECMTDDKLARAACTQQKQQQQTHYQVQQEKRHHTHTLYISQS